MDKTNGKRLEVPIAVLVVVVAAVGVGGFAFAPDQGSLRTLEIRDKAFVPPTVDFFDDNNTIKIVNNDNVSHVVNGLNPETQEVSTIATIEQGESKIVTFDTEGIWIIWSPEYSDGTYSSPARKGMLGYMGVGILAPNVVYGYYNDDLYRAGEYYAGR